LPDDDETTGEIRDRQQQTSTKLDKYLAGEITVIGNDDPTKAKRNTVRYPTK
jgi:hypothetical protein